MVVEPQQVHEGSRYTANNHWSNQLGQTDSPVHPTLQKEETVQSFVSTFKGIITTQSHALNSSISQQR